ncbi:3'-5' exoribonuclease YhaM family protein [Natranaerofaba carboxydovora]|uniref:3'-5' exoribonuclease YhaM family protein n=1 Tax=Natranaerofaba carboxydovora TaxID=2742683 RepID=UPI001F13FF27|nr:HD domain-containing protein [Natranaerofaba carboxydovora]UMZ74213.1 3'-5' exoribonuclease YhaM [Natranaerofaba carboxydovora]
MKVKQIMDQDSNELISDNVFLLTRKDKKPFNNKPGDFMTMELSDDSGRIKAIKWDGAEEVFDLVEVGDIVRVKGKTSEYNGEKQIIVDQIEAEKGNYNKEEFMPKVQNINELLEAFDSLIDILRKELDESKSAYLEIIDNFLGSSYYEDFKIWPAAIKFHHEKLGGLLMHTLNVARHVYFYSKKEPGVNQGLAILGAIFHDIGKIEEYSFETGAIKLTKKGMLFGHKVLGMEIVRELCENTSISDEEKDLLLHIIASHHGKIEYGAITQPKIPEAVLVHHADLMDAECYKVVDALQNIDEGEFGYSDKYKGYVYRAEN